MLFSHIPYVVCAQTQYTIHIDLNLFEPWIWIHTTYIPIRRMLLLQMTKSGSLMHDEKKKHDKRIVNKYSIPKSENKGKITGKKKKLEN